MSLHNKTVNFFNLPFSMYFQLIFIMYQFVICTVFLIKTTLDYSFYHSLFSTLEIFFVDLKNIQPFEVNIKCVI
jgi:hypothetical protein